MSDGHEYRFKIDAYTPDTLPMARLAEYMADLATILGEPQKVHFVKLEKSSAVLVQKIDHVALPKVRERTKSVRAGHGPNDAMQAYRKTNTRLKQDNSIGVLSDEDGAEVISFPGREEVEKVSFGAFNQDGSLDGRAIVIGGKGDPVPVHIEQGNNTFNCLASREIAATLGPYIFHTDLRVRGTGRWLRGEDGIWEMQRFTITSFEILDDQPLTDVVARLRDMPGNGWRDVADPFAELAKIRDGDTEAQ